MNVIFYIAAAVSILAALLAITRRNAVHALLYFIVSLLAMGVIFFALGAPFTAALVVIINAGAIMVLFLFVIMMLNLRPQPIHPQRGLPYFIAWWGPAVLSLVLLAELTYCFLGHAATTSGASVGPKWVGMALFGPYLLAVELASMLLLVGLLGAYHLGRGETKPKEEPI